MSSKEYGFYVFDVDEDEIEGDIELHEPYFTFVVRDTWGEYPMYAKTPPWGMYWSEDTDYGDTEFVEPTEEFWEFLSDWLMGRDHVEKWEGRYEEELPAHERYMIGLITDTMCRDEGHGLPFEIREALYENVDVDV